LDARRDNPDIDFSADIFPGLVVVFADLVMDQLARSSDASGRWTFVIAFTTGLLVAAARTEAGYPAAPGAPPAVAPFPRAPFPQPPNFAPQRPFGPNNVPNFGPQGFNPPPQQPPPAGNPDAAKPAGAKPGILGGVLGDAIVGAIAGGVGGALLGLVLRALRKSADATVKIDPVTGGVIAEYAPGVRYMMYAFSAFTPTVLLIAAICKPPQDEESWAVVGVVILLFAALGGAASWGFGRARAIATDRGIISSSGFRRQRSMLWSEVGEVSYVKSVKSDAALVFKSTLPNGRPIKLGLMMAGLKPLTEQMRKHVPPDRYAKASEALQRIDQLTAGAATPFMGFGAKPSPKPKPTAGAR